MVGKKIGGRTYYYLAESARVDGKPRVVTQRYLGTADEIARAVPGGEPASASYRTYGDVAAVWATLSRLDFVARVDDVVRAKPSLGLTLAVAVLHRATAPETPIAAWWKTSAAADLVRLSTVDGLWRALERLTPERIAGIEETVAAAVLATVDDHAALAVDVPQFAAFAPADCTLPSACQGVLAGAGLRVTRDGAIPLASRLYRRDDGSAPTFASLMAGLGPATLVFHAGQAAQLDLGSRSGFVGSLPLTDHPELLTQPASARKRVDPERFAGLTALDTHAVVDGVRRRVVLTHSATLHAAQSRAFADELATATRELDGLAEALAAGTHRGDRAQVHAEIGRVTRGRRVERVLTAVLSGNRPGEIRLERRIDTAAVARLDEEFFGKQVLVTDRDWPVAEVVTAYRARTHLESTFRWLTGPAVTGPTPRWEWTRQRIAAHGLVSVLAATVTHLMRREADRAGMNLSVRELLDQLAGIGELVLRYPSTGGRPRTKRLLTELDPGQQALADLFQLSR
ncbi:MULTISPECIES: transposase [unclassified Amycolatopsis]|uniref:IS1634 family transposase n=1 Tax=unclassified Amycolatopsis TaxID=2618356 RepID=UPI002876E1FF|nr:MULTISPECIES: transposase [unclassified Amycolatopsis]MDS0135540.1 transposase [Amycolatopsis sp. 505]MDS0140769.1 transposase [Amycolatopsis sp. CM201R]